MLRPVKKTVAIEDVALDIKAAAFPAPFYAGLEYSSPARGTWNIVHTGMLIPETHQIFVCALGCLRGVVLTAAEMGAIDRYSSIMIREENVLKGDMEELMIEGVTDILKKLKSRPKAILLFISCQHFFLAYDQQAVFETLRTRFPDIYFMDCYMIPTLRKSGLTPDQKMRMQMYSLWPAVPKERKRINLIGSNIRLSEHSELRKLLEDGGYEVWDLYRCKSFQDYMDMSKGWLNLYYEPLVHICANALEERIGQEKYYLSFCFDMEALDQQYRALAKYLELPGPDFSSLKQQADQALRDAKALIGDTPIAVDYTFTFKLLSFVKLLVQYGFNVQHIYADMFLPEEEADFKWLQKEAPELKVLPTNQPEMRFVHSDRDADSDRESCQILAIGQKAACFEETDYFVNVVESGGLFGYDGMIQITALMKEAFLTKKNRRDIIQRKGYTCDSCIVDEM